MPWTFAHPLAVLPIKRFFSKSLELHALAAGAVAPDVLYYFSRFDLASYGHSFMGCILVSTPIGMFLAFFFAALHKPLCFVMPEPHSTAFAKFRPSSTAVSRLKVLPAVLLGVWTHTIWDSFTHESGWFVRRISALQCSAAELGSVDLKIYYLLQQLSTIGGALALAVIYWLWLRKNEPVERPAGNGYRYLLLGAIAAPSLLIGGGWAFAAASSHHGFVYFRVLMFHLAIYATAIFVPLLIITSLVIYKLRDARE